MSEEVSSHPSYGSYLQLEKLLSAQEPPDYSAPVSAGELPTRERAHHDELLFIVVHQIYELWFKLVLHELGSARDVLARRGPHGAEAVNERDIPRVTARLRRVNEVLRLCHDHFRLIETMAPGDFLAFRDLIIPASGFQSVQFREMEILAGLREDARMDFEGVPYASRLTEAERRRIDARLEEPTLKEALYDWLGRTPIERAFPGFATAFLEGLERYIASQVAHHERNPNLAESQRAEAARRLRAQIDAARAYLFAEDREQQRAHQAFLFLMSYRHEPLLSGPHELIEGLVEFEQGFRLFRFRHARMVERMIGLRTGSGGSAGVAYLDGTTQRYRIFGELLEARTMLLAAEWLPPLPHPEALGFTIEE